MSTLSIWLHAHRGTAIRKASHATRITKRIFFAGQRLRGLLGARAGLTGWGGGCPPPPPRPAPPGDLGRSILGITWVGSGSFDPRPVPPAGCPAGFPP